MSAPPLPPEDMEHVLIHTRTLWEEMRGQRLFITGGTGFFGCWLVESFCHINSALGLGAEAVILTRDAAGFRKKLPHVTCQPNISLLEGDMRNFAFPDGEFRFVIHAATAVSTNLLENSSLEAFSTILAGTERALEFCTTHGTKKFLLTSSGAVYGAQPSSLTHVPETYLGAVDPLRATSMYAEAKRASELLCALYAKTAAFESKIGRCWAFCGPHLPLDAHYAAGNFIADAMAKRTIRIAGDGTARRSYLYAADLAIWLWTLLFEAPALIPFNVGSSQDVSILQLAQAVARSLAPGVEISTAKQAVVGTPPPRYVPSVARAAEMLGLHERVGLEETIGKTASWYSLWK